MNTVLLRLAVRVLPRRDRARYLRELTADLVVLPPGPARARYAASHLLHCYGLRRALVGPHRSGTSLGCAPVERVEKVLRCRMHLHDMVAFSTPDGGRWQHCSRCGETPASSAPRSGATTWATTWGSDRAVTQTALCYK